MTNIQDSPVELKGKLSGFVSRKLEDSRQRPAAPAPLPSATAHNCRPGCETCGGVGLVRYEVPLEDFRFGKLFPCPHMPLEKLHHEGHFGLCWDEQRCLRWESIIPLDGAAGALSLVRRTLQRGWGWVYLWGVYGTAKSQILKTAVAESVRGHQNAFYTRMVDLLDSLRLAFDEDQASRGLLERVSYYSSLPLLCVDEIERVKHTEWAQERIFQLMDRRYSTALLGRSVTLIASNCPPEDLDGYLASRVLDGRFAVAHLGGADLRPVMRQAE